VPSADQLADPEQAQRWREPVNGGLRLTAALKHVIGPQAGRSDALTGSERAFVFTDRHLRGERPTPQEEAGASLGVMPGLRNVTWQSAKRGLTEAWPQDRCALS
jgi:hypothetical protein